MVANLHHPQAVNVWQDVLEFCTNEIVVQPTPDTQATANWLDLTSSVHEHLSDGIGLGH